MNEHDTLTYKPWKSEILIYTHLLNHTHLLVKTNEKPLHTIHLINQQQFNDNPLSHLTPCSTHKVNGKPLLIYFCNYYTYTSKTSMYYSHDIGIDNLRTIHTKITAHIYTRVGD